MAGPDPQVLTHSHMGHDRTRHDGAPAGVLISGTACWLGVLLGSKKLLGAPGITTRSMDATRGSWPYY